MIALTILMPLPPSTNKLTRNLPKGGRASTASYKAWLDEAGYAATTAWRAANRPTFTAPIAISICLGLKDRRRDAGNCLKPIEDMLVKAIEGLPDDRWNDDIRIVRDPRVPTGAARVTIASIAAPG